MLELLQYVATQPRPALFSLTGASPEAGLTGHDDDDD